MLRKFIAVATIAFVAVLTVPLSAHAIGESYVPETNITVDTSNVVPGAPVRVGFSEGSFFPNEGVRFSVSGPGTAILAMVRTATVSIDKMTESDGSIHVIVTLPPDARDTYTVTATGLVSGSVGTASITVVDPDSKPTDSDTSQDLVDEQIPISARWIASGAAVLGVALIVILVIRRRAN